MIFYVDMYYGQMEVLYTLTVAALLHSAQEYINIYDTLQQYVHMYHILYEHVLCVAVLEGQTSSEVPFVHSSFW